MDQNEDYRLMNVNIDIDLEANLQALENLKTFCGDLIDPNHREEITQVLLLIELLEDIQKISPKNIDYLKQALLASHCECVLQHIEQYEAKYPKSSRQDADKMTRIIEHLEQRLGSEYRKYLRLLGIQDETMEHLLHQYNGKVSEVIHHSLTAWSQQPSATAQMLIAMLRSRSIGRNKLANEIERSLREPDIRSGIGNLDLN